VLDPKPGVYFIRGGPGFPSKVVITR
jgi:hypothetical protein